MVPPEAAEQKQPSPYDALLKPESAAVVSPEWTPPEAAEEKRTPVTREDSRSIVPSAPSWKPPEASFDPKSAVPVEDQKAAAAPIASPVKQIAVELTSSEFDLLEGLSVKDMQGFVNVRNNGTWTVTSVDFVITVFQFMAPYIHKSFRFHAVSDTGDELRPNATGRFFFEPFDSNAMIDELKIPNPRVTWKIVSARGFKPQ